MSELVSSAGESPSAALPSAAATEPRPAPEGASCRTVIVVPCYNEARRLDASSFDRYLRGSSDVELLLVEVEAGQLQNGVDPLP